MTTSLLVGALLLLAGAVLGLLVGMRLRPGPVAGARYGPDGQPPDPASAVAAVLHPTADALEKIQRELHRIERDRVGSYAGLREQVAALQHTSSQLFQQTRTLSGALRTPSARGHWGEVQLKRLVELAGMVEHCDFSTQVTIDGDGADGARRGRPDMVITIAGGRQLPVDAKVPLQAWLEAVELDQGDPATAGLLRRHAAALRRHVDALARRDYGGYLRAAPDFTIMFVPADAPLEAALATEPSLLEFAFSRSVIIATPATLIALLRTVALGWRSQRLSESAAQVHALGRELHGRLSGLTEHLRQVGTGLARSVEAYNATVRSYESRVLVSARRFGHLAGATDPLDAPAEVTAAAQLPHPAVETFAPSS